MREELLMSSTIIELFGYSPIDKSAIAQKIRKQEKCPFINAGCQKKLSDGSISGVCTLKPKTSGPVICCPIRLYSDNYSILTDVAKLAFKDNIVLVPGQNALVQKIPVKMNKIAVFGRGWGKELRLPNRGKSGGYFVDWVLAYIDDKGELKEFVAVEVQSIDTTGNYQKERGAYLQGKEYHGSSTAGFNWENVNKRILPQIIYKGHILRRERLCKNGLFFVCPAPVYDKIRERLGGKLYEYPFQPGALTLIWYNVGEAVAQGNIRELKLIGKFTTTIDQVAMAFTSPSNLPEENVYEAAIRAELMTCLATRVILT
jgi:hypothetical protein